MNGAGTLGTAVTRAIDRPVLPDGPFGWRDEHHLPRAASRQVTDHRT